MEKRGNAMSFILRRKIWISIGVAIFLVILFVLLKVFLDLQAMVNANNAVFTSKREYILNLEFEGSIKDKASLGYQKSITILLAKINQLPDFGQKEYPPFYQIINDSLLILEVSEQVFEQLKINQSVYKKSKDNYISTNQGFRLPILNEDPDKWLP